LVAPAELAFADSHTALVICLAYGAKGFTGYGRS
jgi:hypothetical protein